MLERNQILKLLNDLHQEHIYSQLVQISCYLDDYKKGNLTDIQKEEVLLVIVAMYGDVDAQFIRSGDKINTQIMTELLVKFQGLKVLIQRGYFNSEQMGIIDKMEEENRKMLGKVPRRFDYTLYNYDVPIITRK